MMDRQAEALALMNWHVLCDRGEIVKAVVAKTEVLRTVAGVTITQLRDKHDPDKGMDFGVGLSCSAARSSAIIVGPTDWGRYHDRQTDLDCQRVPQFQLPHRL
jgi:hypothetical protein